MQGLLNLSRRSVWLRILLWVLAAIVLAATFIAYFSPESLIDFATLRLC